MSTSTPGMTAPAPHSAPAGGDEVGWTKGKWTVGEAMDHPLPSVDVRGADGEFGEVCVVWGNGENGLEVTEEAHANARLIAAAPDLYAMVAKAAAQFEFYEQQHRAKGTPDADAKAEVNHALAAEMRAALLAATQERGT